MSASKSPQTYADLDLLLGRSGKGFKEYFYVGNRSPSMEELENYRRTLFSQNMYSITAVRQLFEQVQLDGPIVLEYL